MPTQKPLLAFHGDPQIKATYVARVKAHQAADEIISGKYWEHGKGCAVGCTIHGDSHAAYEPEIGHPRILAKLEDRLFEAIYSFNPLAAKEWPLRFISAAKEGSDLSLVWPKFAHWMLVDPETGVIRHAKREQTKKSINDVSALYLKWIETGIKPDFYAADAADADAAAAAADAADADAAAAAAAADAAAAAAADAADADAAADAAAADADAADAFYRRYGYWPSYRYYRGYAPRYKAGQDRYLAMADKLIELMQAAK